jgi:alkane 1-monooxygenase
MWHLLALFVPVSTLIYVATGPHPWWMALVFFGLLPFQVFMDTYAAPERREPPKDVPEWPFETMLLLLVAMQIANIPLLARMVSIGGWGSFDTWVTILMVGVNSGYSAIVVGHELIHRPAIWQRTLGRMLMASVMYEHFYTEHIRGHHRRVGTDEDGATARFGETWHQFNMRTVPQQFFSAWALERKRLRNKPLWWLQSRVFHGLVVGLAIPVGLGLVFGPIAFVAHLGQSWVAIQLLEGVNYFEHWGLRRSTKHVQTIDSWDAESWFTRYSLVGLSRHADHHANPNRSYQDLRHFDESPKLPNGYVRIVFRVWFGNARLQEDLTAELQRRQLGPFARPVAAK